MKGKSQHIAVIRFSALGDVAMTVPVLNAVAFQNPELKITVVSREFFRPMFEQVPNISFFAADLSGRHKGVVGLYRLYRELKALGVDAIADLHHVLRSRIISLFGKSGGMKTAHVDKARAEKKALVRSRDKVFKQLKPVSQRYAGVFTELGIAAEIGKESLLPVRSLTSEIEKITGPKSEKWIGVAPFAKHQGKVYPEDLMAEVIREISASEVSIFLFGAGKDEILVLEKLASGLENVAIVAGKLRFDDELRLISNLDLMLSMDSGNAHLAAMYGVPTITLWGATHPFAGFAPFLQPDSNAITSDRDKFPMLPTSVYGNKIVPGYEDAMRTIPPSTVVENINRILDQTSS